MESVLLTTTDGHELAGDLSTPEGDSVGGVVVCHPHPQYGGDRFNPVVDAVFRHLPAIGFTSLRFDFRADFGGGAGEQTDVVAALDELSAREPGPLHVVGYSFGAAVALNTVDERITSIVAIAPPLTMLEVRAPSARTQVLMPRHDQFTDADSAAEVVATWPDAEFAVVESADHFLAGRTTHVAETTGAWLAAGLGAAE